tara:strand:+ start:72831 stop:73280 length:450 start_codon:yes stop_codon:yes gene_type:complete
MLLLVGASVRLVETTKYKCLIQLKNYTGNGAYIVASIVDKNGNYLNTLRVFGDDDEWLSDLRKWFLFYRNTNKNVDGITGATLSGGERAVFTVDIDHKYFEEGNLLRFETAVEDQKHVLEDLQLPIKNGEITGNHEGSGYIRYVKILSQ